MNFFFSKPNKKLMQRVMELPMKGINAFGTSAFQLLEKVNMRIRRHPRIFWGIFFLWIMLLVYTLKRQMDMARERQLVLETKKLQFEMRKTLKSQHMGLEALKIKMQGSMVEMNEDTTEQWRTESEELTAIINTFSGQFDKLEKMLMSLDKPIRHAN